MLHYGCNLMLAALETMDEYYGQKQRASRKVRPVFGCLFHASKNHIQFEFNQEWLHLSKRELHCERQTCKCTHGPTNVTLLSINVAPLQTK